MKKVLITIVGLMFCTGVICNAAAKLTAEQKAERKALLEKYDADKNGKLSAEEKGKMTADDKKKWDELNPGKSKSK